MKLNILLALAGSATLLAACGNDAGDQSAASTNAGAANAVAADKAAKGETLGSGLAQSHAQLSEAFKTAGLNETLAGSVPYTLFAPTNEAIGKVSGGLPQDKGALGNILTYHMVPGAVTVADLRKAIDKNGKAELATVGGGTLTLTRSGDVISIKDGKGGETRISGEERVFANGVVHSIDGVLNPA